MTTPGRRRYHIYLCIFSCLFATFVQANNDTAGHEVRDLHYGEVLFAYYQQDYYTALVRLLAAQKKQSLKAHKEEAELLFGNISLAYGLHEVAEDVFKRMTDLRLPEDVRNSAWCSLAEMRYLEGLIDSANITMENITGNIPGQIADNYQMLSFNLLLAGQQYQEARKQIEQMRDDTNRIYASYNLAVSQLNDGYKLEADNVLDGLGRMPASNNEMKALRNHANLSLGIHHLQNKDAAKALTILQRIPLKEPYSDEALLVMGWAHAEQDQSQEALAIWQRLKGRDLIMPAPQEAWIASGFLLEKIRAYDAAVQSNQNAIAAFAAELVRLDGVIDAVNEGDLIRALLQQPSLDVGRELWEMELMPDTAMAAYLPYVMTNRNIGKAVSSLLDLQQVKDRVTAWKMKLPELDEALLAQENTRSSKINEGYATQIAGLQADVETLRQDVGSALIEQQALVQQLVIDELQMHKKRISDYQDQMRLAIARIHDQSFYRLSQ